jgi:hypothetical protein
MDRKFIRPLVMIGLLVSLGACRPGAIAASETSVPAPTQVPASETSLPTPSPSPASDTSATAPATSTIPASSETPLTFDCDTALEITVWDCRALVALFESTHGASWTEHPGWVETAVPCYWFGVTCENAT